MTGNARAAVAVRSRMQDPEILPIITLFVGALVGLLFGRWYARQS